MQISAGDQTCEETLKQQSADGQERIVGKVISKSGLFHKVEQVE